MDWSEIAIRYLGDLRKWSNHQIKVTDKCTSIFNSDAPIPVFTNRSDTDTFYTEMADTDPIPILGAYHCSQEIHSMLHLFL